MPFVLGDERRLSLCYYSSKYDLFSEQKVYDTDLDGVPDKVAILRFTGVLTSYLGGLDEALQYAHDLGELGLTRYYAWEVQGSDLVKFQNVKDRELRHIIILFHDSTFEVVCEDYSAREIESELVSDAVSQEIDFYFSS